MIRVDDILATVSRHHPSSDLDLIRRAYIFAALSHKDQKRDSGEPYLTHPLEVANILAEMRMDAVTVSVGLLHDVVEDTLAGTEQLQRLFGPEIAHLVDGVTKISQIQFSSQEEKQAANFRKLLLGLTDDIRVIMVKFADRLHNMRTLEHKKSDRRTAISTETLDIYAPLAHRLGLGKIRGELEDLAFKNLEPKAYEDLKMQVDRQRKVNEAFLREVKETIEQKMRESGIPSRTEARVKRLYSVYQKLKKQNITVDHVYDLMAVRIITADDKAHCYAALGVINTTWPPVPGRIKDFIGVPRPNGYQSLHTSVVAKGQPFEVQIRTEEMHRIAEEGIAAHWKYKDGKLTATSDDSLMRWLRQLVDWQQDVKHPDDFLSTLKMDLFPEEVQAFTPKGKVISLPRDATPVDFAYAIHSQVGHSCFGAKVNGRMVPLKTKLQNGDTIEILTQPGRNPSRDWLSFVKTARARNKIRHWLTLQEKQKSIELGRKLLEKEARKYRVNFKSLMENPKLLEVAAEYGCSKQDDVLSSIGFGKLSAKQILVRAAPDGLREPASESKISSVVKRVLGFGADATLKVKGFDDVLVYRAKCCNPIPGEKVVGYITRGKGVAVHSKTCKNVESLLLSPERWIEVDWGGKAQSTERFAVPLAVTTVNRPGLLAAVSSAISTVGANISTIDAHTSEDSATINVTVEIPDMKHLERVLESVRTIDGVHDVQRVTGAASAVKTG